LSISYDVEGDCPTQVRERLLKMLKEREEKREVIRRLDDEIIDLAQMYKLTILERLNPIRD